MRLCGFKVEAAARLVFLEDANAGQQQAGSSQAFCILTASILAAGVWVVYGSWCRGGVRVDAGW